jgi:hypothetical protein
VVRPVKLKYVSNGNARLQKGLVINVKNTLSPKSPLGLVQCVNHG